MVGDTKFELVIFGDTSGLTPAAQALANILESFLGVRKREARDAVEIARLHAERERIKAESKYEVAAIESRLGARLAEQQLRDQRDMEQIAMLSLLDLRDDARRSQIEEDWLVHFFDRARLVSNEMMQRMWAKLLTAQANDPGLVTRFPHAALRKE